LHTLIYKGCKGCQVVILRKIKPILLIVVQQAQQLGVSPPFFIFASVTAALRTPEEENASFIFEAFSFRDKSM
jgi:hypothetical protein